MSVMDVIVSVFLGLVGSASIWQFVSFMVDRYDKKKKSNEDIMHEIKKVSCKVDVLALKVDENQAILSRTHILRFADEIKNGIVHSNDYWRQQMQDCDTYERFCEEHPDFRNNYTEMANKYIKDTYEHLLKERKI